MSKIANFLRGGYYLGYAAFTCLCVYAGACTNPSVTSETYSTNDVLLSTETVFLIKVNVKCDGGDVSMYTVYTCTIV